MFKNTKAALIAFIGSVFLSSTVAIGQVAELSSVPSKGLMEKMQQDALPKALEYLMESGVSLTYLGDAGGVAGYLGESPTGKVQTFYITPDGNHVIAGVLFRQGGVNVTGVQINDMKERFVNAKMRAESIAKDLEGVDESNVPAPIPSIVSNLDEVSPEQITAGEAAVASIDDYRSTRDLEYMKSQFDQLAWFSVGSSTAPYVYMIADPNCPYCHRAWMDLRERVMSKEISVRVILIGALKGSREKAISILGRPEPGRAWFAGEGSTAEMPVAPPPMKNSKEYRAATGFLKVNESFVGKNELTSTPYLFAFDKNGVLYESEGWPKNEDLFFTILDRDG